MRAILSATALAFLVSASAFAVDGAAEKATKEVMRQSFRASLENRSEREALTTAVNGWCKAILAETPTNSPAEQKWVTAEGQTTNSERINRLVRTPEFARQQIAEAFGDCAQRSGIALEAQKLPMDGKTLRVEAANLVSLGLAFSSPSDLAVHAETVGINGERLGFPLLMNIRNSIDIAALRAIEDMRF